MKSPLSVTSPVADGMLAGLRLRFLRTALQTPRVLASRLGWGPRKNEGVALSPELRWLLRVLSWDPADYASASPGTLRSSFRAIATSEMSGPWIDLQTEDFLVDGNESKIATRVYTPRYAKHPSPLIFWMHGGGWVIGSIETHDRFCRQLCEATGAIVVAVDYRLAPESPFPAALDDVRSVWSWIRHNTDELGADPSRLAIGGDSAGGQMTSVLCQELPLEERPALQILCYAGADFTVIRESRKRFEKGFLLDSVLIDWFLTHYARGRDWSVPQLSPLYGELADQPPALVVTAGLDPLLDEGLAYLELLENSGSHTVHQHLPCMIHGFITWTGVLPGAAIAIDDMATHIREML